MKENEKNILDEINKGATMGMDAIHFIIDKIHSDHFREIMDNQYKEYRKIVEKISSLYPEYSEGEPHETGTMNKVMTWYGIEMKTMIDETDSKLAEILMQGTNMGIIEGRRILNHKEMDSSVKKIVSEYVNMQESAVEKLKEFL